MADEGRAVGSAGAWLKFNGRKVGHCQSVSVNETIDHAEVRELGEIDPIEHVPNARSVSWSAGFVRVYKRSFGELGVMPRGGTLDVLRFPKMTLELWNRKEDAPILKVEGARIQSVGTNLSLGGVLMSDVGGVGITVFDEQTA
jgi:hypothetical protein